MKNALLISLAGVLIAGCASFQTEILEDPGKVDSLTVGQFITANPVDNELIGSYLRKELTKQGFNVTDDSQYVLSGVIDTVTEARIVLSKNSKEKIAWNYTASTSGICTTRKCFSKEIAKRIYKTLRE